MREQLTGLLYEDVLADAYVEKFSFDANRKKETVLLTDVIISINDRDEYVDHMWIDKINGIEQGSFITLKAFINEYKRLNNSYDYNLEQCELV